jgi:hypothetical protein
MIKSSFLDLIESGNSISCLVLTFSIQKLLQYKYSSSNTRFCEIYSQHLEQTCPRSDLVRVIIL